MEKWRGLPYTVPIHPNRQPMKPLLVLALLAMAQLTTLSASACEKHLQGHQNGSNTEQEASRQ
jgi:hypothetical protein